MLPLTTVSLSAHVLALSRTTDVSNCWLGRLVDRQPVPDGTSFSRSKTGTPDFEGRLLLYDWNSPDSGKWCLWLDRHASSLALTAGWRYQCDRAREQMLPHTKHAPYFVQSLRI